MLTITVGSRRGATWDLHFGVGRRARISVDQAHQEVCGRCAQPRRSRRSTSPPGRCARSRLSPGCGRDVECSVCDRPVDRLARGCPYAADDGLLVLESEQPAGVQPIASQMAVSANCTRGYGSSDDRSPRHADFGGQIDQGRLRQEARPVHLDPVISLRPSDDRVCFGCAAAPGRRSQRTRRR
jgi:hypothetical protein